MTTQNIIEGLTILEKYREKPGGYNTGADHDTIYAYATNKPVSNEDVKRLVEIGWAQQDVDTGDDDYTAEHYDPGEGWRACV